jgi:hypothetical protein
MERPTCISVEASEFFIGSACAASREINWKRYALEAIRGMDGKPGDTGFQAA